MSGRLISDHSSWVGKGSNGTVFPAGAKMKQESSANSSGSLSQYEDTTESIKSMQNASVGKVKGHPHKAGTRN
jgi:hypothetical protein